MTSVLDLLFPRRCLGCGQSGRYFCSDCLQGIGCLERQICPVCARASIYGQVHVGCRGRYSLDGLISVFSYSGLVKRSITQLKYKYLTDLGRELAKLTGLFLEERVKVQRLLKRPMVVPVPLHPLKKRSRGFNQTELLGKLLAKQLDWGFESDCLRRLKYTRPQVGLKKKERRGNVRGAFAVVTGTLISGEFSYLLFDDVWTSGSTLKECARVLKKAGASQVWGLTLCR